jgi:hypothetical protein
MKPHGNRAKAINGDNRWTIVKTTVKIGYVGGLITLRFRTTWLLDKDPPLLIDLSCLQLQTIISVWQASTYRHTHFIGLFLLVVFNDAFIRLTLLNDSLRSWRRMWGGGIVPRILNLGTRCRWVVNFSFPDTHWTGWVGPKVGLDVRKRI